MEAAGGGSYYVESLTQAIMQRAWGHIKEVEELGGMAKAIESGLPKMRIEEVAARKQGRIDSGKETIIGVNRYQQEQKQKIDILEVDNRVVRKTQIERLALLRSERNEKKTRTALDNLTKCAKTKVGNLLELSIEAARCHATLGEISLAMEKIFQRYSARIQSVSGVYSSVYDEDKQLENVRGESDKFAKLEGRRPRILVAKIGQDGHDRGAKIIATAFADLGFDVDIGPLFQTPLEVARQAVENDVHIVGISSLAAAHKTLVPQLVQELARLDREDIEVVIGGVIPPQDYDFLRDHGVIAIFGPGTKIPDAAIFILKHM